ncbi:hypothetical protein DSO57_1019117 [Entomophthora muscae]|uniref:Uncharacterized protein n=1 Tax=Entomophthora muscae TaxID=34485 RepID=A0ACC2UNY7_9FUNG|nr:hypothetical protein DSO57_1019117 [Entomophthora muscae]
MGFVSWFKGTYLFTHLNVGKYTKRRKTFRRNCRKSESDMIQRYLDSGLASNQYCPALPIPQHPDPHFDDPEDQSFFDVQLTEAPRRRLTAPPNTLFLTDAYRTSTSLASLNHLIRTQ